MNKSKVISSTKVTTTSSSTMTKKKLQEIVSNSSINNEYDQTEPFIEPSSPLLTKSPTSSPLSTIDSDINNTNLPLIIDNNAKQINNQSNLIMIDNSEETIESISIQLAEMEDLDEQTLSARSPNNLQVDDDVADGENAIRQKKLSLTLPLLDVVITDTTTNTSKAVTSSPSQPTHPNKTKKFYESDDTFIQTIFSQTITSTTATPTDDYTTYPFDEFNALTPMVDPTNQSATNAQQPESLNDDTQTEKLDMYKETLISFTDIVDMDNACKDGNKSDDNDDEYNKMYENWNAEGQNGDELKTDNSCSFYDNVDNLDACDNYNEPNLVDDGHDYENVYLSNNDGGKQFCQDENQPLTSYFDQTIEEDDSYNDILGPVSPSHPATDQSLIDAPVITNNQINTIGNTVDIDDRTNTPKSRCKSSSSSVDYDDDVDVEDADKSDNHVLANAAAVGHLNGDQQADVSPNYSNFNMHVSLAFHFIQLIIYLLSRMPNRVIGATFHFFSFNVKCDRYR